MKRYLYLLLVICALVMPVVVSKDSPRPESCYPHCWPW